jgi:hypothetical protein
MIRAVDANQEGSATQLCPVLFVCRNYEKKPENAWERETKLGFSFSNQLFATIGPISFKDFRYDHNNTTCCVVSNVLQSPITSVHCRPALPVGITDISHVLRLVLVPGTTGTCSTIGRRSTSGIGVLFDIRNRACSDVIFPF